MFASCNVQNDATVDLPRPVSTTELVQLVSQKAKTSAAELLTSRSVKVNLQVSIFEEMVLKPCREEPQEFVCPPISNMTMVCQALQLQQKQIGQQNELMQAIVASMKANDKPRLETVKPDMFDGHSSTPKGLIDFYEYASEKNGWEEQDRSKNMRRFLTGVAKKWYDLHLVHHPLLSWSDWKASFLSSFKGNPVDRWDQAIFYKYKTSLLLEYFFFKKEGSCSLLSPN